MKIIDQLCSQCQHKLIESSLHGKKKGIFFYDLCPDCQKKLTFKED